MRALLISTYDLGRQPFGLASPAAWLRREGVEVACVDVSKSRLTDEEIAHATLVAFYLPMHTATRLAVPLIERVQRVNPAARVCCYGLYAALNSEWLRARGVHHVLGAEYEEALTALALGRSEITNQSQITNQSITSQSQITNHKSQIPRLSLISPDRSGLPPLARYASLEMPDGSRRVVGATDATRGCKHLCRHCPVVPVYQGQFRVVPVDVVVEDVRAQVAAGAQHISFGDPDFFNGPSHARRVVERLAAVVAGVTYDVTIKIEHLLRHADLLPLLADTGCLFVTSAVESIDDEVLRKLAKGHTRDDFIRALDLCRAADLTLSPTFIPFTPWTTIDGYVELLETIAHHGLVEHVAPIQLAIRLLVTAGSPLLDLPDIRRVLQPFDGASLTWPWRHEDGRVDRLHAAVMDVVGVGIGASRGATFQAVRDVACDAAGRVRATPRPARNHYPTAHTTRGGGPNRATVPYLNEPWYC
jgi:radical SAM superfamily enzyme YgiQ (UPF0313 family)